MFPVYNYNIYNYKFYYDDRHSFGGKINSLVGVSSQYLLVYITSLVYIINNYKIRHETKAAYSQNTIKSLKTYNIIKSHAVHKFIIYNDNNKHTTRCTQGVRVVFSEQECDLVHSARMHTSNFTTEKIV